MASRVGVSRMTIRRLEEGNPRVSIAILLRVLEVLDLDDQVDELAAHDELGLKILEATAPGPRRTYRLPLADEL
jgi:transcriptional regulator with XRE-family HTH domain